MSNLGGWSISADVETKDSKRSNAWIFLNTNPKDSRTDMHDFLSQTPNQWQKLEAERAMQSIIVRCIMAPAPKGNPLTSELSMLPRHEILSTTPHVRPLLTHTLWIPLVDLFDCDKTTSRRIYQADSIAHFEKKPHEIRAIINILTSG